MTGPSGDAELLGRGRAALRRADWAAAQACFEDAARLGGAPEALDGLGEVAHFTGDYDEAIALRERAFAAFRHEGEPVQAARTARGLAFLHATCRGNWAVAAGWMARAASLLDGLQECAAHGWLALDRAPFSQHASERERVAVSALAIGRRFRDADLEFGALALLGETQVASGRVAEGMGLLDEAMAAATAGEVADHAVAGEIYCRLLSACEHALDVRRAEQWMAEIDRAVVWRPFVWPTCRTHYGGILVALGRWAHAETELLEALRGFERGYRGDRVYPLVRLADLRVRQGRFEEAERLLDGVDWHPTARRASATIALARGDLGLAEDLARLCFEGLDPLDLGCAPLLDLIVQIGLVRGDLATATETVARLGALAGASGDEQAGAFAELAAGRLGARTGDGSAIAHHRRALERFASVSLPLEAARAQLELARAMAPAAPDAAVAEARAALEKFELLGAMKDADAAAAALRRLGASGRAWPRRGSTLTKREEEVLALLAAGLSNAAIADRLYISRRTAEHHVASILSKLGLRSRAEAAAYAVRRAPQDP